MRLLLIRHGQTQANVDHLLDTAEPGNPLTEHGHQQALDLVTTIKDEPLDALFASKLIRAQQTAAPLAQARGLQTQIIDGVQEIAAGVEEMNSDWSAYIKVLSSWSPTNLDAKLESGESAREFMTRFDTAIAEIEALGHENVGVVSHGAAIRVWASTKDLTPARELLVPLRNTQWVELVGSQADGWRIRRWGDNLITA